MHILARFFICCALATAIFISAEATLAQVRSDRVEFAAGQADTTVRQTLRGREIRTYLVAGVPGKKLAVGLQTSNPANYFNVSEPDAAEAVFIGSVSGNYSETLMTRTGDYRITVYLMPSAARRNEIADYLLSISLQPASDLADGLSGGPDYWEVTGVRSALRLRGGPSLRHGAIGALNNGEVVRNLGCQETDEQRWCRVETLRGDRQGWVAGRFLREGAAPQEPDRLGLEGNGQRFDATGTLPCAPLAGQPTRDCSFGVIRESTAGNAGIWIDIGQGEERYFTFEGGKPVYSNGAGEISVERLGDLNLLRLGGERYEIPDAVIYGG